VKKNHNKKYIKNSYLIFFSSDHFHETALAFTKNK